MPDQPYSVDQGFECCQDGGYRLYSCAYCPCMKADRPPCLVVTGDLDAARRRLAPPDDAAIERAARALYAYGSSLMAVDWDRATETTKMQHRLTAHVAIVALAAAEANTDA